MIRKILAVAVVVGSHLAPQGAKAEPLRQSVKCLADNIYFEARDDGPAGWSAVGNVTLNRWREARLKRPNIGICSIVYAGVQRGRHSCQFSWACDGRPKVKREKEVAEQITRLAYQLIENKRSDPTRGATFFHERGVHPDWARDGTAFRTVAIGRHYYYRAARPVEVALANSGACERSGTGSYGSFLARNLGFGGSRSQGGCTR